MGYSAAFVMGVGVAAVAIVVVLALANKHVSSKNDSLQPSTLKKVSHLYRIGCSQGAQAAQDKNPLIALVHVATAKAYLDAAQHVSGGAPLTANGVDTSADVREKISETTRSAMKTISHKYPKLAVSNAEHFSLGAGWVV